PGPGGELGARKRPRDRGLAGLVRRADQGRDAGGTAKPRRVRLALQRAGLRLPGAPHRSLPLQRSVARDGRAGAGRHARARRLIESAGADRRLLVALGVGVGVAIAAWIFAFLQLWQTSVPSDLSLPHLDPSQFFTQEQLAR